MDETASNLVIIFETLSRTFKPFRYLAIVETVEDNLEDGENDHADCRRDDEGVGGGEGGLLLLLGPDGADQQLVSLFYLVICKRTLGNTNQG